MNYNKKKTTRNVILIVSLTFIVFGIMFAFNDIKSIIDVVSKIDMRFFVIAIALTLIYFILYPVSLFILMKHRRCKISFKDVFVIGSTEHFFNGVTPFATGGQPFLVYAFHKKGIKSQESIGILMMNYIIFMIVTNLFAIASLFYYQSFTERAGNIFWLVICGFGANFFVLFIIIAFGISKHIRNGLLRFLKWLNKFKFFHKIINPRVPALESYMDEVQSACKELFHSPIAFFGCFAVKVVMMAIYYLITFFIIKAIYPSLDYAQMLYILLGTSFAITMVVWVPTPGGTGGIEFAFSTIFAGITAGAAIGVSSMLLWRALTFYFVLILSFICYLIFNKSIAKEEKIRLENLEKNEEINSETEENEEVANE